MTLVGKSFEWKTFAQKVFLNIRSKGFSKHLFKKFSNPLTPIGSPVTHVNWPINWPDFAALPARLGWPARSRHTVACLLHRFSHLLRWERLRSSRRGYMRTYQTFPALLKLLRTSKGYTNASSIVLYNPLTPIGSPVTHVNWPMNWPDFAASPARLGWPARSRHTVACMHRFSHLLRWPPEPKVWFLSAWRAVAIEQARLYADLPIISSCFEIATGVKGLNISSKGFSKHILAQKDS